jgi:hypothetical protein
LLSPIKEQRRISDLVETVTMEIEAIALNREPFSKVKAIVITAYRG